MVSLSLFLSAATECGRTIGSIPGYFKKIKARHAAGLERGQAAG